jgi:hypothetical protein
MATGPIIVGTNGSAQSLQAVEWAARKLCCVIRRCGSWRSRRCPPLMSRHERKAPPETVAELVIGSARGVLGQDVPELGHEAQ